MNKNSPSNICHSYLSLIVIRILSANGFSKSSHHSIEALTRILELYLVNLSQTAIDYAQHSSRTDVSTWDVTQALEDALGDQYLDSLEEILDDRSQLHFERSAWEVECNKSLNEHSGYNLRQRRPVKYDFEEVTDDMMIKGDDESDDTEEEEINNYAEDLKEGEDEEADPVEPSKKRFKDDNEIIPDGFPDLPNDNNVTFEETNIDDVHSVPQLPKLRPEVNEDIYDPYLNPIPYDQSQLASLHSQTQLVDEDVGEDDKRVNEAECLALLLNAHSSASQIPQMNTFNTKNVNRERIGTLLSAVTLSDFSASDSLYGIVPSNGLKNSPSGPIPNYIQNINEDSCGYYERARPVASLPSSAMASNALFKARSPLSALSRILPSEFNKRLTRQSHPQLLQDGSHKFLYGRPLPVPGKEKDESSSLLSTWEHNVKDWTK